MDDPLNSKPGRSLISYFSSGVKKINGINLAQGRPGFSPPQELNEILSRNISISDLHQYGPGDGDPALLGMILELHPEIDHLSIDNVLITQGATEAIFLSYFYISGIVTKNRSVLSLDPPYESYPELAKITGRKFIYFSQNEGNSLDRTAFRKTVIENNTGIILIASPGNPEGKILWREDLRYLTEIAEEYDMYIIFDNVYRDIYYNRLPDNPFKREKSRIFYINSFSKMLSITGWRIGYLICEENHMKKIKKIHDYTGLSAVYIFQRTIAEYLKNYDLGRSYIKSIRKRCRDNFYYLKKELEKLNFRVSDSDGGYFLWAQLPGGYDDAFIFAERLLRSAGTAVVPGENFSPNFKKNIRINISMERAVIEEGCDHIRNFLKSDIK